MDKRWIELERAGAVEEATKWLDNVVTVYERAAREAKEYRSRFVDVVEEANAGKGTVKPHEVLSWAVNATNFPANNVRLDMAGVHMMALSEAYRKVKALAKAEAEAAAVENGNAARFMLTGARTVLPSLKSARFVAEKGVYPTIIELGDFETCYVRAERLNGGRMNASREMVLNSRGRMPVVVTGDWTYHITKVVVPHI